MLKINNSKTQIFINNTLVVEDTTFLDEPDKLIVSFLDMLKYRKESSVASFVNDFEEVLIIFVSNPWNECVYVLDRKEGHEPKATVFNVDIKKLANSLINDSDILQKIEDVRKRGQEEIALRIENHYNDLKENINNSTIYNSKF